MREACASPCVSSPEIYGPLDPETKQIRVIDVGNSEANNNEIQCTLKLISLDECPKYSALSYAWGDLSTTSSILLDGEAYSITQNLHDALRHFLRELRTNKGDQFIWIDALCINQHDIHERNQQIQLMNSIYTNASIVHVWLGPEEEGDAETFEILHLLSQWPLTRPMEVNGALVQLNHLKHLRRLLTRPWWRRLWTLQEVVLAPLSKLRCGSLSIEFQILYQAFTNLGVESQHLGSYGLWPGLGLASGSAEAVLEILEETFGIVVKLLTFYYSEKEPATMKEAFTRLFRLLVTCRAKAASDERDKVYGLLGLLPSAAMKMLEPTYDEPYEQTFIRTAFLIVQKTESLSIFSQAGLASASGSKLPSWVPNWTAVKQYEIRPRRMVRFDGVHQRISLSSSSSSASPSPPSSPTPVFPSPSSAPQKLMLSKSPGLNDQHNEIETDNLKAAPSEPRTRDPNLTNEFFINFELRRNQDTIFSACAGTPASARLTDHCELVVQGKQFDIIAKMGDTMHVTDVYDDLMDTFRAWWIMCGAGDAYSEERYIGGGTVPDAFWRTLLNDAMLDASSGTFERYEPSHAKIGRAIFRRWYVAMLDYYGLSGTQIDAEVQEHICSATRGRGFIVTSQGYFGLGPGSCVQGDAIWILAGATHPCVLRPAGQTGGMYRLVGECYVQGVMDGEAFFNMNQNSNGNYEEKDFSSLCEVCIG